ncbi:cation-translocating P-type ATPase [Candidatus Oscillochloris fontis]|uniref:cation-translocating P-type ATPase n=1 Tax=Candidatus Oscillochloris fontis TaxID=2496868 RepID=UPI001EE84BC4|nr:cation-transporting P-type ATPase [Candidatus Oscillochloris fontis]
MATPNPSDHATADWGEMYRLSTADALIALGTGPTGLAMDAAEARLVAYGPNRLPTPAAKPLLRVFLENFTHLMALLLWVGGIIGFIAQMPQLAIAIWSVNLINGLFSFWQEFRAERAAAALRALLPAQARVLRAGVVQEVPREALVPGDLLVLAEGDLIAADGRLIEAAELRVDQATLTGESRPVPKHCEIYAEATTDRVGLPNLVFTGTTVVAGTAKALVFATGAHSAFGQIAHLTETIAEAPSPLQQELARLTRVVSVIAVSMGGIFFGLAVGVAGVNLAESLIFAMGMIVAFVPEGLLPTVTLALAIGVQRMARRNALVKRLSAVETLGCTEVICTDKTGTLTQNAMTVRQIWAAGRMFEVQGGGYTPVGAIVLDGQPVGHDADLETLLRAAALCNDARLIAPPDPQGDWTILGDPTEAALLVAAHKAGLDLETELQHAPRIHEIPFESRRKMMSSIHQPGQRVVYVKGAPNEVLACCVALRMNGALRPLDAALLDEISTIKDGLARSGLRVLGVAMRDLAPNCDLSSAATIETDLTFLGLIAMYDPPRPEVAAAVTQCHQAGIRIIMITGDDGLTATTIAQRLQIVTSPQPRMISGSELAQLDEPALAAALQGEVVFARVAPEQKLRIVSALQHLGKVVAVTGDGVNDAPALKQADIGVAMGKSGTDVARESADMILTDDNFATIVHAIEEGRAVYANIRKFVSYIFTSNVPEAVPFVLFALTGGRIPLALTVMQILAIDLGTDMVPALGLGAERPEPGLMARPPRRRSDHIISRGLLVRSLLFLGMIQGAVAMLAFFAIYWSQGYAGLWLDLPAEGHIYQVATTATLAAIVATQIGNLFAQRTTHASILAINPFTNRLIWIGIGIEILLILAISYVPWLQWIFGTAALPASSWLLLLACVPVLLIADELRKAIVRA